MAIESTRGQRQDAAANRDRILRAAHTVLTADPEGSVDDVARAAGVVRRTVYAHFPSRAALVAGLAEQTARDLLATLATRDRTVLPADVALADFVLTLWRAGDRYRLLIALAEHDLGAASVRELLAPVSAQGMELLERARAEQVLAEHLPVPVLSAVLQASTLALLRSVNLGLWADDGSRSAVAILVAAGMPYAAAGAAVAQAREPAAR